MECAVPLVPLVPAHLPSKSCMHTVYIWLMTLPQEVLKGLDKSIYAFIPKAEKNPD